MMQAGIYTCTIRKSGFVPPKGWPPQAESNYNKVDTVASRIGLNTAVTH